MEEKARALKVDKDFCRPVLRTFRRGRPSETGVWACMVWEGGAHGVGPKVAVLLNHDNFQLCWITLIFIVWYCEYQGTCIQRLMRSH